MLCTPKREEVELEGEGGKGKEGSRVNENAKRCEAGNKGRDKLID